MKWSAYLSWGPFPPIHFVWKHRNHETNYGFLDEFFTAHHKPRHASMSHMLMAAQLRGKKQRQRGLPAKSNDPQYDHFNKHMSLWGFSRLDSGILYNERNCFNTPEGQDFVHSPFWVFQCSDRSCKQSPYCVSEPACSLRLIILIPRPCVPGATFVKGYHFITNSFS